MNNNLDYCDTAEELIFGTFAEFKSWIQEEKGEKFKEIKGFTAKPITIVDATEETFLRLFRVADHYQSGEIHYCRR